MPPLLHLEHTLVFNPEDATAETLRQIPSAPGVFALRAATGEPYLTRAADLRRRITRLLAPPDLTPEGQPQSKRLNLRNRVRTIEYTVTGSDFESLLILYDIASATFTPAEARRRLRLHPPYCLRLTIDHSHPRVYSTNRLSRRSLSQTYGPFPSRLAAERYCDAVLDLFKLRRCYEDLQVHPEHPGCAYGEMKKCLAPCNTSCTPDDYAAESRAVESFFGTHGESLLTTIAAEREQASAAMEFEAAAAAHERYTKVKSAAALADEIVRPIPNLRAIIVQPSAIQDDTQQANLYLLQAGCLHGPQPLSTLGVRAVKEQTSVGSSLFAQPLMLQAVPLGDIPNDPTNSPELRAEQAIAHLESSTPPDTDPATLGDHLSLLRRWYFRPEKQRTGEIFFPNPDGSWPIRRILRGAARTALGDPRQMADINREAAPAMAEGLKMKMLHEGREGVERPVPILQKRRRKATLTPTSDSTS